MTLDINQAARALADALEAVGVPYAVGGAIAYGYWGAARGTKDVDLNVFVPNDAIERALDALVAAGLRVDRALAIATACDRGDARGWLGEVPIDLFFDSIPRARDRPPANATGLLAPTAAPQHRALMHRRPPPGSTSRFAIRASCARSAAGPRS